MNHYEIGRHLPDFETLRRIAKALKVLVAYFYAESDDTAYLLISSLKAERSAAPSVYLLTFALLIAALRAFSYKIHPVNIYYQAD